MNGAALAGARAAGEPAAGGPAAAGTAAASEPVAGAAAADSSAAGDAAAGAAAAGDAAAGDPAAGTSAAGEPAAGVPSAGDPAAGDLGRRAALIAACRELVRRGLTHGSSGNIGLRRDPKRFFMSPTGMAYEALEPDDIPLMDLEGRWFGRRRPSSEWRFHRDIFRARPEVGAIVHVHSPQATALACTGRGIPAFHYMVAAAGGADIRCAPYHTFGTQSLADAALAALEDRRACLLANHGLIALGGDLAAALALAGEVESLAAQYCAALAVGGVRLLDAAEMRRVNEKFRTYGKQDAADPDLIFGGACGLE
jgi:L-fuculose-phosphate aldolase